MGDITPAELAAVRGRLEGFADDVFAWLPRLAERLVGALAPTAWVVDDSQPPGRRVAGTSTANSRWPRRRFWTKACPATITLALRSCSSPRIGRSRAFSLPWSHATRSLAYRSVRCHATGTSASSTAGHRRPTGGDLDGRDLDRADRPLGEPAGRLGVSRWAIRQPEAQVPADRQHDPVGWKPEAGERGVCSGRRARAAGSHAGSVADPRRSQRTQQRRCHRSCDRS